MKKQLEVQDKNVESAILSGLKTLNKSREDVDIKIICQGGMFKKAKVILSYEENEAINDNQTSTTEESISEKKVLENVSDTEKIEETDKEKMSEDYIIPDQETKIRKPEKQLIKEDVLEYCSRAKEFLTELCESFKITSDVNTDIVDNTLVINVNTDKPDVLIGYKENVLNALQNLLYSLRKGRERFRINFDVNNYKKEKVEKLRNLALSSALKCEETNRNVHLDNMNAFDRRIIHTTLQNSKTVTTKSTGVEPNRHVVIMPKN